MVGRIDLVKTLKQPPINRLISAATNFYTTNAHHGKSCLMPYANNNGVDQPAHPDSLVSLFFAP